MSGVDDVERVIEFQPLKGVPCDPRHMIAGHDERLDGCWTSGFFDRGTEFFLSVCRSTQHSAVTNCTREKERRMD